MSSQDSSAQFTVHTLEFRFAEQRDIDAIVSLVESAYRGDASRIGWTTEADLIDGQRTDSDAIAALIGNPEGEILLALFGSEYVASCELSRRDQEHAYFGMFAVRPKYQGGGVGRAVLAQAERLARLEWESSVMVMTVIAQREELISWYERRGFRRTGAVEPFPYGDERFGVPRRADLEFVVLEKAIGATQF